MTDDFFEVLKIRRSHYALGRNVSLVRDQIEAIVREAVRLAPSSYNSQSSRVLILFGDQSDRFWSITTEALRAMIPADKFASTEARMKAFAAGIGTILFFEDQQVVAGLQQQYPLYADNFLAFSEQSSGMAQFAVWSALASAGIGASLQHYNPVVDTGVAAQWTVPSSWKLLAQMPFGSIEGKLRDKSFLAEEGRIIIHGALEREKRT